MDDSTQNDDLSGEQIPEPPLEDAADQPPAMAEGSRKFRLTWQFVAGFFGWYLVMLLIYGSLHLVFPDAKTNSEFLFWGSFFIFLVQIYVLINLIRHRNQVGWGMLAAIGVNFMISLALGQFGEALCFIPFFTPVY